MLKTHAVSSVSWWACTHHHHVILKSSTTLSQWCPCLAFYHNTCVSYVSFSHEVGTYRGNIVFALTRPAQPKQLLPWTLRWTLLRGKTSVCRVTPDNKWVINKNYLAQGRRRREAPPRCLPPAAQTRDRDNFVVSALLRMVNHYIPLHMKPLEQVPLKSKC